MEVIRFINDQPVSSMPAMKVRNEGVLQIIKEIQMRAILEQQSAKPSERLAGKTLVSRA